MGLLGGLLSIGGDLLSGVLNNDSASDRQDSANAFSAQQYASRWQTTTADMKAAGLNPMLAYSQGVGSAPSGAISSSAGYSPLGQSFNSGQMVDSTNERNYASAGQARSQAKVLDETVRKVEAEIDNVKAQTELTKGNTGFDAQQRILQNTASLIASQFGIAQSEDVQRAPLLKARIDQIVADTRLKELDITAAGQMGNLGRLVKEAGPVIGPIMQIIIEAIRFNRR